MDAIQFDTERYLVDIDRANGRESDREAGGGLFEALLRDDQARYEPLPDYTRREVAADRQEDRRAFIDAQQSDAEAYRQNSADDRQFDRGRREPPADERREIREPSEDRADARMASDGEPQRTDSSDTDTRPARGKDETTAESNPQSAAPSKEPDTAQAAGGDSESTDTNTSSSETRPKATQSAGEATSETAMPLSSDEPILGLESITAVETADASQAAVAPTTSEEPATGDTTESTDGFATMAANQPAASHAAAKPQQAAKPTTPDSKPTDAGKSETIKSDMPNKTGGTGNGNPIGAQINVTAPALTSHPTANLAASATMAAIIVEGETAGRAQAATTNVSTQARPAEAATGLGKAVASTVKNGGTGNGSTQDKSGSGSKAATQQLVSATAPKTSTQVSGSFEPLQPSTPVASDLGNSLLPNSSVGTAFAPVATTAAQLPGTAVPSAELQTRAQTPANPADQVAVQIQKGLSAGKDRISIKLNPAELGRIDIKMELADDGRLRAMISAERPETLEMLQRDARILERTLQDAGVKTDSSSLSFTSRDNRGRDEFADAPGGLTTTAGGSGDGTGVEDLTDGALAAQRMSQHDGSLDISV